MLGKKIVSKMLEVWGSIVVNGESITGDKINTWNSAVQPGDNVSVLSNDSGYVDSAGAASAAPVQSVNSQTGAVSLDADDIDDTATANKFVTAAEKSDIATAVQPGDLATVATTGAYSDLTGTPTLGTAAAADTGDFATAAQGSLADTAIQSGDLLSTNIFNQNASNTVAVSGTTETTVLNPNTGTLLLSNEDCAAGQSYEFALFGEFNLDGSTDTVTVRFYIGTQSVSVAITHNAAITSAPLQIKGSLDFIGGIDTARTASFSGVVTVYISNTIRFAKIPTTELTEDVSSGATFDITSEAVQVGAGGLTIEKAMLNRVTYNGLT